MRARRLGRVVMGIVAAGAFSLTDARRDEVTYHDPNMDFGVLQTVAVLPFENLTGNPRAADAVRDVFMTMLQATGTLYVVPPGEVSRGIARLSLRDADTPSSEEAKQLAENLGAEAVITGTVTEYGELRSGGSAANAVSVSIKMMEAQTGRVVFSASASEGGITMGARMFGGGGRPMNEVTRKAVRKLLDRLFE